MTKEKRYKLFEYLSRECNFSALESNLDDIENIINPVIYPYTISDEPTPRELTKSNSEKEYTKDDLECAFYAGREFYNGFSMAGLMSNKNINPVYKAFEDFVKKGWNIKSNQVRQILPR